MKPNLARIVLATILVSLLSYSIVYACSIIEPTIIVKCSNFETSIIAFESRSENETPENYQKRVIVKTIENLHAVSPNCKEDLSPVLETFEKEIAVWLNRNDKRILLDRDLILEPYSTEKDIEMHKNKNNLFLCRYEESQHIGDWLIVFKTGRPYCLTYWYSPGGMCPVIVLSLGGFLLYLLTNLSFTTLPYLAGWLLISGAIIYAWWMLLKNRPAMKQWKLLVISLIIFVVALFLIIPPFWVLGQIIGWILVFGLIVVWYKQREGASKQKTG
jgi:hypothetical protein